MYQAVTEFLIKHDADMGAAEAHGIAVGMLCIELKVDGANWLHELCPEEQDLPEEDKKLMLDLFDHTRELLAPDNTEFSFDLLLPDDNEPLFERIDAISSWCQGFLFGVGYVQSSTEWPGDTAEVMQDIIELTKMDSDVEGEENEEALIEIHEYLRVAVLSVRDQFIEHKPGSMH